MTIRTVSLCLIRRGDQILVEETYDEALKKTFYRPIGGTMEHGENSKQTVVREVKEEINAVIKEPKLLFVIENVFKYLDQIGHEIDFIYEADLVDTDLNEADEVDGIEGETTYKAVWKSITDFVNHQEAKLVPDGLLELLLNQETEKISHIKHVRTT